MSRIAVILSIISLILISCGDSDNPVTPDEPDVSFSFVHHQDIGTAGAADFEAFEIGAETYLAVANAYNGSTVNIDSKISLILHQENRKTSLALEYQGVKL